MTKLEKVAYTAHATSTGGREGVSKSDDGRLDIKLSTPEQLGGAGGDGTNPEQLFAAGYSACFLGAMKYVASQEKIDLPENVSVAADVSIGPIPAGFGIAVKLTALIPDLENAVAQELLEKAHQVCPYSNATRGNIDVEIELAV